MSNEQVYENAATSYGSDSFQEIRSRANSKRRSPQGSRRGKSPQSFNGMHRRRRKKVSW